MVMMYDIVSFTEMYTVCTVMVQTHDSAKKCLIGKASNCDIPVATLEKIL